MSKPMTYTRIGELAWNDDKDVQELIAEVRRLRECIKNAPHEDTCAFDPNANPFHGATGCDCWKRQALGGE